MDTILHMDRRAGPLTGGRHARLAAAAAAWLSRLVGWSERARQRRGLMLLDDRMLKDIGLSRADALREYVKPFWQE